MSVLVVGSINVDITLYLDRWPDVGETVQSSSAISLGGKGANQAMAAARLNASVAMLGGTGADAFGMQVHDELVNSGIALRAARLPGTPTGIACIDVGPEGGNTIRLVPGANAALGPQIIHNNAELFRDCKVLLLQNEIPLETSLAAAAAARNAGAVVIMDPAPAPSLTTRWIIETNSAFDILTPNLHEAAILLVKDHIAPASAVAAAEALAKIAARGAIITMGKFGVAWFIDGQSGQLEAPRVKAVDTVAAGDCFNGALAAALARGESMSSAISFACNAAALATTRRGASSSLPTLDEVTVFAEALLSSGGRGTSTMRLLDGAEYGHDQRCRA